jgi:hypothetical protein
MISKLAALMAFSMSLTWTAFASDSSKFKKEFFLSVGSIQTNVLHVGYTSVNQFTAPSQMAQKYSEFNKMSAYTGFSLPDIHFGMNFCRAGKKYQNTWRIGLTSSSATDITGYYNRQESYRIDTFYSTQTNAVYYIDSTVYHTFRYRNWSNWLHLDVSKIWRTDNPNKFTLYTGIGAVTGVTLNSNSDLQYNRYSIDNKPSNSIARRPNYGNEYYETENIKNKTRTFASVYVPLGIDYRLSKKKIFWSKLHLFYEGRFSLNQLNVPEVKEYSYSDFNTLIGIRYQL